MSRDIYKSLVKLSRGRFQRCGRHPNQYQARPIIITLNPQGAEEFNKVYQTVLSADLNKIERAPSGAIVICRSNNYAYDTLSDRCGVRLTVILDGCLFVWRIGREKFNASGMMGWKAWQIFLGLCDKHSINIDEYSIEDGAEVKKTIEKPLILMLRCHEVLENVNHIDFHSSYPSGLALTHPEFRPIIEELYNERKRKPSYKDVLNCVIGYMQSLKKCRARWAHLSRDAISNNNTRVNALAIKLQAHGRVIVGYNTDGIWYQGPVFHDYRSGEEGPGLGQWSNDHVGTTFRAKSDGAYEFIENGKYNPVIRGFTNLDYIKPRKAWEWGDIYQERAEIMKFKFDPDIGIVPLEESEYEEEDQENI